MGAERGFPQASGVRYVVLCIDGHQAGCRSSVGGDRFVWFRDNEGPAVTVAYAINDAQVARAKFWGAPASVSDMRSLTLSGPWDVMATAAYDAERPFIPDNRVVLGGTSRALRDWLMVPMPRPWLTRHSEVTAWMWRAYNFVHAAIRTKVGTSTGAWPSRSGPRAATGATGPRMRCARWR